VTVFRAATDSYARLSAVVCDAMFYCIAAELVSWLGREQRRGGFTGLLGQPMPEDGNGVRCERGDPILASLAVAGNVGARAENERRGGSGP
jgi:hypothetical protein